MNKHVSKPIVRKHRCAVYTRKSSEEGLDMEFNSLDAQREACEAYVASQRQEGWVLVPDRYDDGGVSGGTLDRPALQRLTRDVQTGLIDVVVVYKIDRLSRSLTDFSKLVEVFEANQVTFVSVTQSFNTTTSMGRLTLNILLSFAQFEREVIGERIRDKFLASRKKGMWMGGTVPFGYRVENRKLIVEESEAATVRMIFERFLSVGSATILARQLHAEGVTSRSGKLMDKGWLYKLLNNRVFVGEAVHKRIAYPGEHQPIISRDLWDKVHSILTESPRKRAGQSRRQTPALLKRPTFRAERTCDDANPHAQAGPALPLLRQHERAEARTGYMPDQASAGRRDRGGGGGPTSCPASFPGDDCEDLDGRAERGQRHQRARCSRVANPLRSAVG